MVKVLDGSWGRKKECDTAVMHVSCLEDSTSTGIRLELHVDSPSQILSPLFLETGSLTEAEVSRFS